MYVICASCLQDWQNKVRRSRRVESRSKIVVDLIFSLRVAWKVVTKAAVSDCSTSSSGLFSSRLLPRRTNEIRADLGM